MAKHYRRGTKLNPFDVGERVRFKGQQVRGTVREVSGRESGNAQGDPGGWNPIMYRVEKDGPRGEGWYAARDLVGDGQRCLDCEGTGDADRNANERSWNMCAACDGTGIVNE